MTRRLACVLACVAVLGACRGPDPGLTSTGEGKPTLSVEAPPSAEAGDVVDVTLTITNPGPGDISEIGLAFARLGDPQLPYPIVEAGRSGEAAAVVGIDPRPLRVSEDGSTYFFPGPDEKTSEEITFRLEIPNGHDTVGNSIQVFDAQEGAFAERAAGVPLEIEVRG